MFPSHSLVRRSLPAFLLLGCLLALFAPAPTARAQTPPTVAWASRYRTFGSGNSSDNARAVAVDAQGNVYVTGDYSTGSASTYTYKSINTTVKYDAQGNQLWKAVDNSLGQASLFIDAQGSVYVSGFTYAGDALISGRATIKHDANGKQLWGRSGGILKLDGQGNVYTGNYSLIVKYDTNGSQLWQTSGSAGASVVDAQGSLYTTYSVGVYSNGSYTNNALVTVKYDAANGNQLWMARFPGDDSSACYSSGIALDAQGNVYITGTSSTSYRNGGNAVTIKYDTAGKQLWANRYNGNNDGYQHGGNSLIVDAQGSVYVSDSYQATYNYNGGGSILLKYDTDGNLLSATRNDGSTAILVTNGQDGFYNLLRSYSTFTNPTTDAIVKYDANGNQVWSLTPYQGPGGVYDSINALAADAQGNVYTTGRETSSASLFYPSSYITVKYSATAPAMPDITSQVSVTRSGLRYVRATGLWTQTVTVRNAGIGSFAGPLYLALDGLGAGVTLSNRAGMTGSQSPLNSPYLRVALTGTGNGDSVFDPGESVTFTLQFSDPNSAAITYTTRALAGPGTP